MLSPALKSSLPLLIGMFITKCIAIGLSLIPVLIVDLRLDNDTSALALTMIRGAMLFGPMIGGYLMDELTPRRVYFLGLSGSALGMFGLSIASNALMLVGFGVLAQLCGALVMSTARYLLFTLCKPEHQIEALGWFRTVNNGAQIFSYSLGWGIGHFGLPMLYLLDAVTSLIALAVSYKMIPKANEKFPAKTENTDSATDSKRSDSGPISNTALWKVSILMAAFGFLIELFLSVIPAKLRLLYGEAGVPIFSQLMLLNVGLCALLTIFFSKNARDSRRTLLTGIFLIFVGVALGVLMPERRAVLYFSFLVLTLGELLFQSLAQYVVMRLVPEGKRSGSTYGLSVSIHAAGRLLGASTAFPLFIYGENPMTALTAIAVVIAGIFLWSRKSIPV